MHLVRILLVITLMSSAFVGPTVPAVAQQTVVSTSGSGAVEDGVASASASFKRQVEAVEMQTQEQTISTGGGTADTSDGSGGSLGDSGGSALLPGCYTHITSSVDGRVVYALICPDKGGYQGGTAAELFGVSVITLTDPATGETSTVPAGGAVTTRGTSIRIDAAALAEQALASLDLPGPTVHMSPEGRQIVALPSWLWIAPSQWEPRRVAATAGPVTSTVTVTPVAVTWDMGDGTRFTCARDDMRVYAPQFADNPEATNCKHTYTDSSAGQPGDVFDVTAELTWRATWEAPAVDEGGVLPDQTTTASSAVPVAELQALVQ
jgi:hypothetical protein